MNKAFTLVELLAVIIILFIISLITVPIIIDQIEITKKKSIESGKYLYIENF